MTPLEKKFYKRLGANIRHARTGPPFTQEELAKKLKMTRPNMVNIEKGGQRVHIYHLVRISEYCDCDIRDLIPGP